jgi:hypothetical protein
LDKSTQHIDQLISTRLEEFSKIPPGRVWDQIEKELDKMWPQTNGRQHPANHSGKNNTPR